ncbi:hypothetical protein SCG7086_AC_00330 [Chlamydiales bacterium SCGC AG-110-P3]|nr:hypothetical protein SCG7086_AC_00330 [Chlamydiales bacterium SCGC AG-110-P3]
MRWHSDFTERILQATTIDDRQSSLKRFNDRVEMGLNPHLYSIVEILRSWGL